MKDEVQLIPIASIRILNFRHRDRKKFEVIVDSIRKVGLKKPIQVSTRSAGEGDEPGYDLVFGQGRMEACIALGYKEIPAIIVEVSKEDRLLRSLVENIARRFTSPIAVMHEIDRLKAQGYSNSEIGRKIGIDDSLVGGYIALNKAGEERLLDAVLAGRISVSLAMEIAKADTPQVQRELLKAYERKDLPYGSIRTLKRLIDQRRFVGKQRDHDSRRNRKNLTSAESLVNAYRRESQRQKLTVRKARLCEAKLAFIVTAFKKLLGDENFGTLLRAESLCTMPKCLWERLHVKHNEAT
jgi:ParB family transcriptional regulator, chromosome partitioning protein